MSISSNHLIKCIDNSHMLFNNGYQGEMERKHACAIYIKTQPVNQGKKLENKLRMKCGIRNIRLLENS